MASQPDVTREVLAAVQTFLGGPKADGDQWCFEFGEHLESNWGAVYGGALAASALTVARSAAPDRPTYGRGTGLNDVDSVAKCSRPSW